LRVVWFSTRISSTIDEPSRETGTACAGLHRSSASMLMQCSCCVTASCCHSSSGTSAPASISSDPSPRGSSDERE